MTLRTQVGTKITFNWFQKAKIEGAFSSEHSVLRVTVKFFSHENMQKIALEAQSRGSIRLVLLKLPDLEP